ncbi:hypothetical protein M3Y97_00893400 [Aphelenchoides bicaudatus]|nr:hypothetical protein M3Y97_00893400 [Aphelenchoides bicaudatus]
MASIIKNQIVKHLSVFARNITPNQISVEVLRGKGELRNIILNEDVLSEKLELPPWLRIKHASCNRVTVKIPWMELNKKPVELHVDEIHVTLELCADNIDEFKQKRSTNKSTSYGFGDKVIEGMSIFVNTVEIEFTSSRFRGSVMLSRLDVQSQTPRWEATNDLKNTRFSDHTTQKVMNFKCVSWQLLRIEARAIESNTDASDARRGFSSPLRLITNNGKCRIAIKKSHTDNSLVCGRLQLILEEVLWIVTLPQLRSAISFGKHILELIKKSTESTNEVQKVAKSFNFTKTIDEQNHSMSPRYARIDFNQSSNHFYVTKMDLHLYDDGSSNDFPSDWNIDNGAIQLVLSRVSVDVYPNHTPLWKRTDWVGYDTANSCASEAEKLVAMHLTNISEDLNENEKKQFTHVCQELRSQNIVIRINDLLLFRVSQQNSKKESLIPLINADNTARQTLPQHTSIFHMELASYYYLNPTSYPTPRNMTHLVIGPLNIVTDPRSIRWLVYVFENIANLVDLKTVAVESDPSDLKVELILPKIYFELPNEDDDRLPRQIVASFCTISASNYFYECTQIAETSAFDNFMDKSSNYVGSFSERLVQHVKNGRNLLLLKGQADEKFFLIKCASFALHSEIDIASCHYPMSNAFSINIYIVEENESKLLICADPLNTVQISLDHFQFIQITRLQEMINELVDKIKNDREFFGQRYSQKMEQTDLLIYALIDRILVNIVLPPIPIPSPYNRNGQANLPCSETDESLSSSSLPQSSSVPKCCNCKQHLHNRLYEETASIITTNSEEEVQLQVAFLGEGTTTSALGIYDDVFKNTIPVAEEAIFVEENDQGKRETNRYLSQVANSFEIQLNDTNVVVAIIGEDLDANGYVTNVQVDERLKIRYGDIIRSNSSVVCDKSLVPEGNQLGEKAKFKLTGRSGRTEINVGLKELDIELSDIIVSHLGPFFQSNSKDDNLKLEVDLQDSVVKIKVSETNQTTTLMKFLQDPQKSKPLKLTIGQIKIEDGDYEDANEKQ